MTQRKSFADARIIKIDINKQILVNANTQVTEDMVKLCTEPYPCNSTYQSHFEKYPFELSNFQKYAIESIIEGNHVLVTAHTGSGKTLPAEFAIEHFVNQGKKVIYTSPIKALSNQKFYEFTNKFPHISFGILTGDIKTNPEADVLIVTAEILLNTLYNKQVNADQVGNGNQAFLGFDMDFENELACVVMDEVHYINDADRGRVWEETLMLLPPHVQLVMLSATIDAPEKFANWVECRGESSATSRKTVYLASTNHRVVPLTHYSYITTNNGIFKAIKDKELEKQIRELTNKPHVIQSAKGEFNEPHYHKMTKMLDLFQNKNVFIKRQHVLNNVCKYMVENDMLPALCFVLSRKQLEVCAREITVPLLEDDSKVGYIVRRECEQIIRKLPNYQEYLELPEYLQMVSLLEKGIAIHHAGITPVLREMVELLFGKGYIKLLFATETFSIGISFPIKTVLFTDCNKFDGTQSRILYSHEYTQMAGRAGRRGIDTVGHVIHLNNLFRRIDLTSYKLMMQGKPQKLVSKFKVSYSLILSLISIGDTKFTAFAKRSMIQQDLDKELACLESKINEIYRDVGSLSIADKIQTPVKIVEEYASLLTNVKQAVNKKRKEIEKRMEELQYDYRFIETDKAVWERYQRTFGELENLKNSCEQIKQYLDGRVDVVLQLLKENEFIENKDGEAVKLTTTGYIASQIKEVHCLIFAQLLESRLLLHGMSSIQLVGLFSCFTNCTVSEEMSSLFPKSQDLHLNVIIGQVREQYDAYIRKEDELQIQTGVDYTTHYDLIDAAMQWCDCENIQDCKIVLQTLEQTKGVFLGEFVKALLKINNISSEMEKIAESRGDIAFLSTLKEIPLLTLKFVATNQSLYV
jgi:superfamily II RNA helicase